MTQWEKLIYIINSSEDNNILNQATEYINGYTSDDDNSIYMNQIKNFTKKELENN